MKKNKLKTEWRLAAVALLIFTAGIIGRNWLACFGAVVLLGHIVVPAVLRYTTSVTTRTTSSNKKKQIRKKNTRRREEVVDAPKNTKGLVQ